MMPPRICGLIAASLVSLASDLPATTSGTFTLTTYNIHSAIPAGDSNATYKPSASDLHNVADVLTTTSADLIGLQEVRSHWFTPSRNQQPVCPLDMPLYLGALMDMNFCFGSTIDSTRSYPENRNYLQWGTWDQWTNNGVPHGEYGNAILSRAELVWPPSIVKLPRGDAEARKNSDEARNALRVELKNAVPGLGPVVVYNTHFQHNNAQTREAQMRELLRQAKADATTATVFLMGDFNHYPREGEADLLGMAREAGFHDLAELHANNTGTEPAPTMPSRRGDIRIDYIFCSKPVKTADVQVLETPVSDHYPLTVTINLQ